MNSTMAYQTPGSACGAHSPAVKVVAFTVSVAVSPGFTETGESEQLGIGAGPLTEQDSEMVPAKLPCAANVSASVTRLPRFTARLVDAGVIEKSETGLNAAVTD